MPKLSRRTFLQAVTATTLATQLKSSPAQIPTPYPEIGTLIPDEGWHLWIDEHAPWKDDAIFLPEDVNLATLPTNPPTGGWQALTTAASKQITLPTTVEQHFWGKFGSRPYTPEEYRYAAEDPIPQNGAYFGVSWWFRTIDIPAAAKSKRIFLHIRGARLRAEVYLNQKLVGYSIMEELPFECDLTAAANPGTSNHLAIRITNPFGRFDWVDGLNAQWGAVNLYRSHGFAGLDRGLSLSIHNATGRITDAWVLNTAAITTIQAFATVELTHPTTPSPTAEQWRSRATVEVFDPVSGKILPSITAFTDVSVAASTLTYKFVIEATSAKIWDLDTPNLYHLRIKFGDQPAHSDTRTVPFGFRWFGPSGLGLNALFRLNSRRVKIYTAISWGFWGLNGLFPTPELAEKEVTQAKKLNLNCLNFHRNIGKEEVFRANDRIGLLRYMEPGGGKMAIGKLPSGTAANAASIVMEKPTNPADKFAQRYMIAKCIAMVRAFRSHPSLIQYTLQNEIGADLSNPDTLAVLAAMRAEDPSRCIVLNDGFVAAPRKAAQAWYEPYYEKLHRSDEESWGGWWNQHQGAGDQWYDAFYKAPTDFTYKAPYRSVLTEFGEMEGCATPDNHSLMIHQITQTYTHYAGKGGSASYDLTDHKEILAAYDKFIDRWNFRKSFPATERLWLSIGSKCYDTWQNYLENARISDDLDFAAISGWETTAIENHSGIVDNLRNFKSDPTPISGALQPIRPVAKQRNTCIPLGEPATFDLFYLNDTPDAATGTLSFTAVTPSGKLLKLGTFPLPDERPDQFTYLLQEAFATPPLTEEGLYRFKFALSSEPLSTQVKDLWVANTQLPQKQPLLIAVSGITPALHKQLAGLPDITIEDFTPGKKYAAIVSSGITAHASAEQQSGDITGLEAPALTAPAPNPAKPESTETDKAAASLAPGSLAPGILDAVRSGTPLLAIPQADLLSDGVAKQLASAGAFTYNGTVGDFRAPWMGNWYFVRKHPIYSGLPTDQVMGIHYQVKGRQSNGLLVEPHPDGAPVEIIAAYSRDHDRNIGAGTFTTKLGDGKLLYQRVPELHPILQQRFLANALTWLTT